MTDAKDKADVPEEKDAFKKQERAGSDSEDANTREKVGDMVEQIETPGITGL
jgi:hypothetical protein